MPPIVFRYDHRRFRRALAVTFLVGTSAAFLMAWAATLRRSLLARLLAWLDLPPGVITFVLAEAVVVIVIAYAALHARRRRDEIRLLPEGIEIRDSLGRYLVKWENVAETGVSGGSMAGLRLRDREQILESHAGTEEQRALLA